MFKIPQKISSYIVKIFLVRLLLLCFFVGLLIFITNIMELLKNTQGTDVSVLTLFKIVLYQIPQWINTIMPFIIMVASILTFSKLSSSNEMSIIRAGGLSAWQFLSPVIITSFLIGILIMFLFNPISTNLNISSKLLRSKYIEHENKISIKPDNGIWFKQEDLESGGEIIFRANKIYKDDMSFDKIIINYVDLSYLPTQRLEAKRMILKKEGFWYVENVKIIQEGKKIMYQKFILIPTKLKQDFINATITNNYEKEENISFWTLPGIIKVMKQSGLSFNKFRIHFHYLLMMPFLFAAVVLIGAFFSLNHTRSNKNSIMMVLGIVSGFFIYFTSDVMLQFGKIGKIPFFISTWLVTITYLIIGIVLIIKKEE